MTNDKKSKKNLEGSDIGVDLKHFIYLDRSRLESYSSQLLNGIVQSRRFSESRSNTITESSPDIQEEQSREQARETNVNVGPKTLGSVGSKKRNKVVNARSFTEKGLVEVDGFENAFSEEVKDFDNAYLSLEEKLIKLGLLQEIKKQTPISQYPKLVKLKGTAKFFDWSILEALTSLGRLADLSQNFQPEQSAVTALASSQPQNFYGQGFSAIVELFQVFSIGPSVNPLPTSISPVPLWSIPKIKFLKGLTQIEKNLL